MRREIALVAAASLAGACAPDNSCPAAGAIDHVRATDATHVEVALRCPLSHVSPATVSIEGTLAAATTKLDVRHAGGDGTRTLRLETAAQTGLATYTLRLDGVQDPDGHALTASANFVGLGDLMTAPVTLVVDDRYAQSLTQVSALVTFDPETGVFTHFSTLVPLSDPNGDHIFTAAAQVAVDKLRTIATTDDRLGGERQAYAARAVSSSGAALSRLITFEVTDDTAREVGLPLSSVPTPPGPEGLATVHVRVDDTPSHALTAPSLRISTAADGSFDPAFPTTLPLVDPERDGIYEATAQVRIDPARHLGGQTSESFPYVLFVANAGVDYPGVGVQVAAPDEHELDAAIRIGNPALVPVTFRVDVTSAYLDAAGTRRGVAAGEAVFLTGEFGTAEDAFGQNAADAFTGGENVVLEMVPRHDHPGVWERTIFLAPDRPYGWKAVRCPAGHGCAEINRHVTSSGRAFATVMKNLASENLDPSTHAEVRIVDPRQPTVTLAGGTSLSFAGARVHIGSGTGAEPDPTGTPDGMRLFKQELPDLVVQVGQDPVITPVYVVGSWRDVNLPETLAAIVAADGTFDLNPWDYDAGFVGAAPPSYDLPPEEPPPPPPPPPPFVIGDGLLDDVAIPLPGGSASTMTLHAAISGTTLYVASQDAGEGSDHFLFVSATMPTAADTRPATWAKAGTVAAPPTTLYLADENDSSFAGWFRLGATSTDETLLEAADTDARADLACGASGGVLEGAIDLASLFGGVPTTLYLAVGPWASADGGVLFSAAQMPISLDGNGNLDANEFAAVPSASLVLP